MTVINESRPLVESVASVGSKRMRARIIEGERWGSSGFYSKEMLKRDGATAFPAGTQMYLDHPSESEEYDRPERSVRDLAAKLVSPAVYEKDGLYADIQVYEHMAPIVSALAEDIGLSIRAAATVESGEAQGRKGTIITSLVEGISVDFVTNAGAGGKVVGILESARKEAREAVSDKAWSDFSASDYTPAQWRRACLIDTGEGEEDSKSRYKLPVREPEGAVNRNGVHAAAARLNQVQGISAAQKRTAARALVSLYRNQLDEDPPESLTDMAAEAKREAKEATYQDRYQMLELAVREEHGSEDEWIWLRDFDDNNLWFQRSTGDNAGNYQQGYTIEGTTVTLVGDPIEVVVQTRYVPVSAEESKRVKEARNIGQWVESMIHRDFTNLADNMAAEGRLTRDERIILSSAIGDGLEAFVKRVEADAPQLYSRDLWDEPGGSEQDVDEDNGKNVPGNPPAGTPTPSKESSVTDVTISESRLRELEESAKQVDPLNDQLKESQTKERNALVAEAKETKRANEAEAALVVYKLMTKKGIQGERLAESLSKNPPLSEDGKVDVKALTESVNETLGEVEATVDESRGGVRGFGSGEGEAEISEADLDRELAGAFGREVKG